MTDTNGQRPDKPRMDVNLLTPNDYRRLRAKLKDRDLDDLLANGQPEDIVQTLILGFGLRTDPDLTWDAAGDMAAGDVFDMGGGDREPDPPIVPVGSPGPGAGPKPVRRSSARPRKPASAPKS